MRTWAFSSIGMNLHFWISGRRRRYDVTAQEFEQLLGSHVSEYLVRRPDVEFTTSDAWRLGLTESIEDSNRYLNFQGVEWDIEEITLSQEGTHYVVDAATKGIHRILTYTLKIMGSGVSTERILENCLIQFGVRDRILAYMAVDAFCSRHPGRA